MSANFVLLLTAGVLFACGMYLLLDRAMTRMLFGILLAGNGVNLLVLTTAGPAGSPPIMGRDSLAATTSADPLAQAMILTSIVITMAMTAFIAALAYRQYRYRTADVVADDREDAVIAHRPKVAAAAPDHDASSDPTTGRTTARGDNFGPKIFEAPLAETSPDDPDVENSDTPVTAATTSADVPSATARASASASATGTGTESSSSKESAASSATGTTGVKEGQ